MFYYIEYIDGIANGCFESEVRINQNNLTLVSKEEYKKYIESIGCIFIEKFTDKERIERLEEEKILLESCILELAELQSKEIQNRIDLENAVIELAGIIGGA